MNQIGVRTAFLFAFILLAVSACLSGDVPKDFKQKVEARYKHCKVKIIPPRILVSPFNVAGFTPSDADFNVHYDHFYPTLEIPSKWAKRNNLDDRTS